VLSLLLLARTGFGITALWGGRCIFFEVDFAVSLRLRHDAQELSVAFPVVLVPVDGPGGDEERVSFSHGVELLAYPHLVASREEVLLVLNLPVVVPRGPSSRLDAELLELEIGCAVMPVYEPSYLRLEGLVDRLGRDLAFGSSPP